MPGPNRRDLLKALGAAPVVLAAGQAQAQAVPQGLAPMDMGAIERSSSNFRLFQRAGTDATLSNGQIVRWAGNLHKTEPKLMDLRVKDPNSTNTFMASANSRNVAILTDRGNLYELKQGTVYGKPGAEGEPNTADFSRGATILNGVMASKEYKAETSGYSDEKTGGKPTAIKDTQFKVVADAKDAVAPAKGLKLQP
jgi:hypothetical protein